MIENKLKELFSELYQEESRILNDSDVDMTCELDTQVISKI